MTPEQCRNVSLALRNSEKFQKAIVIRNKKYRRRSQYRGKPIKKKASPSKSPLLVKAETEKKLGEHCILLTKPVLSRLLKANGNGQLLCHRCAELLRVGDVVVSRGNSGRLGKPKRKYYHTPCWEGMFF